MIKNISNLLLNSFSNLESLDYSKKYKKSSKSSDDLLKSYEDLVLYLSEIKINDVK